MGWSSLETLRAGDNSPRSWPVCTGDPTLEDDIATQTKISPLEEEQMSTNTQRSVEKHSRWDAERQEGGGGEHNVSVLQVVRNK